MSNAIDFLIENEEISKQIGQAANKIKEIYSIDKIYNKWVNFIKKKKKV